MHLHIVLMKLSNCGVERSQTLFHWIFDLQTAHTQLTVLYGRPFRKVFTLQISTANWRSYMGDHSGRCLPYRYPQRIDELKEQPIQVWCNLDQDIINMATDQWCKRLPGCVRAKGTHFKHTMWTQSQWLTCSNTPYFIVKIHKNADIYPHNIFIG